MQKSQQRSKKCKDSCFLLFKIIFRTKFVFLFYFVPLCIIFVFFYLVFFKKKFVTWTNIALNDAQRFKSDGFTHSLCNEAVHRIIQHKKYAEFGLCARFDAVITSMYGLNLRKNDFTGDKKRNLFRLILNISHVNINK